MLIDANMILFYVDNPAISANFYADLLDNQPIESSATFAMFLLKPGLRLGLWSKHTVEPRATILGGGGELAFQVAENKDVDELYSRWQQQEIKIIQPPTIMDFGYTFTALDPDNHRLRIFTYSQ